MTNRLRITFGLVALTAATSGVGCGATEPSSQNAGTAAGGTAASGGGQAPGAGGSAASQNGGAAGAAGNAGSGPTGQVGTLGQSCSPAGALACAGNHQKLTIVCGGDGKWATNQTCGNGQFCDTRAGTNVGTCQSEDPQCVGKDGGYKYCVGYSVYQCGPDALDHSLAQNCAGPCVDGACVDNEPCPTVTGGFQDCSHECLPNDDLCGPGKCNSTSVPIYKQAVAVRTASAAQSCTCSGAQKYFLKLPLAATFYTKATVAPPWTVTLVPTVDADPCVLTGVQCVVGQQSDLLAAITDDPGSPPRNVTLTPVDPGATCP
jgi:hypothetical protein